ncbi:hypothetical protein BO70DRAFT_384140 [Aspergillus heteromorphus CBS 117.55]|uniref:WD40 repeat-like protein n=1 Tax=Aspergillus heteromorphus CBS 117.55 TaxID=1448321 RepID=A0A317X289_9EURO|nr:uncharacterized protein BO70DRAFT_384140 [Aspergillus heteromorphus CBS 117.55]PWY92673.1 hypothetical protein BO70DRAFT_384140 [Aspergillus heteromorphus CBS 117.55]
MTPQHPPSTTTVFLDQPPSCLQFHPTSPNHLVIGTYLLSEHSDADGSIQQTKTGSLQLWHLDPATHQLSLIEKLPLPHAVFDLHFHPQDPTLLGIATSAGSVSFYRVAITATETSSHIITHLATHQAHPTPNIPALFLAWTPPDWPLPKNTDFGFAVTFSDGSTTLFASHGLSPLSQPQLTPLGTFNATQPIEVWFVALATIPSTSPSTPSPSSPSSTPYLFTGNDFGSVHTRSFDPTALTTTPDDQDGDGEGDLTPLLSHDDRSRHHTAGVTAILPLPIPLDLTGGAPWLLTGSYDESLRVYCGAGGGVWRLRVLESRLDVNEWVGLVLASCMHGGTRVVRVRVSVGGEGEGCEMEVLAEFTEHESMNYASDVWGGVGAGDVAEATEGATGQARERKRVVVSSSFYDRRVCVWMVDV